MYTCKLVNVNVHVTAEQLEVWKPEGNPFDLGEAVGLVCSLFILLTYWKNKELTMDFKAT